MPVDGDELFKRIECMRMAVGAANPGEPSEVTVGRALDFLTFVDPEAARLASLDASAALGNRSAASAARLHRMQAAGAA